MVIIINTSYEWVLKQANDLLFSVISVLSSVKSQLCFKKLMYKTIPNICIFLNMPKTNAKTEYI